MSIQIQGGLLEATSNALAGFEGKKPIGLSVRIIGVQKRLVDYINAWRTEELNPAIKEFTDGGDTVLEDDIKEFSEKYKALFNDEIEVDITPFKVLDFPEKLTISDTDMMILLQTGLVVE